MLTGTVVAVFLPLPQLTGSEVDIWLRRNKPFWPVRFSISCSVILTTPLKITYYLTPPVQMVKSIKNNKRMIISKEQYRTSLVVQWLRLHTHNAGALGSSPGQGTRSHMPQLRVHMPQLKIPHAATKTWGSQINKYILKSSVTVTSASVCSERCR